MNSVWISAIGLCGATLIGAVLGFGIKELPHKWNDTVLGYCAGIMLAASTLGLIVPAFEEAGTSGWWMVVIGVMVGALFLNVLDLVTPHLHHITGLDEEQHRNNASLNHILLFCLSPYSFWHVSFSCFAEPLTSIPPLSPLNRKKRVFGTHFLSEGGSLSYLCYALASPLSLFPDCRWSLRRPSIPGLVLYFFSLLSGSCSII